MKKKEKKWKYELSLLAAFVSKYPECLRKETVEKITPTGQKRYKDWYIYTNKKGEDRVVYFSDFSNDLRENNEGGLTAINNRLFHISYYLYPDEYHDLVLMKEEFADYLRNDPDKEVKHPNNFTKYMSYDEFNEIRFGRLREILIKRNGENTQ
jgi:hypothetical protein